MDHNKKCSRCGKVTGPRLDRGCDSSRHVDCAWYVKPIISMREDSYRDKPQRRCDMILLVMKLEEIMSEHFHNDELAGHHYVIPIEKLDGVLAHFKDLTDQFIAEIDPDKNNSKIVYNMQKIMKNEE